MKPNRPTPHSNNKSSKTLQIKSQVKINHPSQEKANHQYQKMLIRVLDEVFPD